MSIAAIKNPWVRRAAVVAYLPVYVVLIAVISAILAIGERYADEIEEAKHLIEGAWRGEP